VAAEFLRARPAFGITLLRLLDVGHVDRLSFSDGSSGERLGGIRQGIAAKELGRPVESGAPQHRALEHVNRRRRRVAKSRRALGHRIENGLHVRGRIRGLAQHLADCGLLIQGLLQLGGALLDLALQAGVGLAQLRAHAVELVAERLELVAGAHRDLLLKVALADTLRAFLQRADRAHHAAREPHRRQGREEQTRDEHHHSAQDRGVERGEHLGYRLLDEHLPAERIDRRVSGQFPVCAEVVRDHGERIGGARLERRLDLLETGEVGLAQHQADVRVGDQEPRAVDHVGLALLADLDARDHVPDELQVHLGHRHRPAFAAGAHRDRHVGLGFLAEVHRPEPGLPGARVLERRVLRAVLVGAGDVHREARHRELLAALGIDLRDVGHRRHEAQQLQELDAPLLQAFDAELRQRGKGELLLDLAHELLDARRGGDRLLALQGGERALVFLIGEVQPDGARNQQRAAHQGQNQQEIFAEQSPAPQPRHVGVLPDEPIPGLQASPPVITLSPCRRAPGTNPAPRCPARAPS
jgi:hypothetical protein